MIKGFTHDAIDAVQKGKTQFVTTFVKHEGLAKTMNTFIETQAKYTKAASDAFIDSALSFGQLAVDKNFGKELVEAYGLDKFIPATQTTSKKAK
jgi:hypothetical protein